jgi:hypothetical protein
MKFLTFVIYDVAKSAEVSKASDKVMSNPPPGYKLLAQYVCLARPFDGIPPNSLVSVGIAETESAEALAAISYPIMLAGATFYRVPVLEMPIGAGAAEEKKYRG